MLNSLVYEYFKKVLPDLSTKAENWFPAGKNTIRFTIKDEGQFVFRCNEEQTEWHLNTVDEFIENMLGV